MSPSPVLARVKSAMSSYYALLSRMPHYRPESLCIPPPEGWTIDAEAFRDLGKSDAAIDFARHLPFMDPCVNCEKAWITPLSPAIAIHRGEKWPAYIDTGIGVRTPPHVLYLSTSIDGRSGVILCLDTQLGRIIEVCGDLTLSNDEYELLPEAEKWTAMRSSPAEDFFLREAARLRKLIYLPVSPPVNSPGTSEPRFYQRATNVLEENSLMALEDEWEADHEDDSDFEAEDDDGLDSSANVDLRTLQIETSDDETDGEYEDLALDEYEIEDLRADDEEYQRTHVSSGGGLQIQDSTSLPEDTLLVYDIYKRNGWPYEHFDVAQCRAQLVEFAQRSWVQYRPQPQQTNATRPSAEAWCEDRRQRMKQKFKAEGKDWDDDKEKTQTASDWWAEYQVQMRAQSTHS